MFWSQHLGCWGQNTSRIQNKEVYATLCLQVRAATALLQMAQICVSIGPVNHKLEIKNCATSGVEMISAPSTLGAVGPNRNTSRTLQRC